MKSRHILILQFDILIYPPAMSLIEILLNKGCEVHLLGYCSNLNNIKYLIDRGLKFKNVINYNKNDSRVKKLGKISKFRTDVLTYLKTIDKDDKVWFLGNEAVYVFSKHIPDLKSILYFFEVPKFTVDLSYKIWANDKSYKDALKKAERVISCEANRALVTKAFFGLTDQQTVVIPNKTAFEVQNNDDPIINGFIQKLKNKKVVLYQGGFNFPERRLDELCQSAALLPEEYLVVIMGPETPYKEKLRLQYEGERVFFLPFIKAPYHMHITKIAHIGFLTYFPNEENIEQILNVLYCAPNKIFEYAQFSTPMLSNDLPALNTWYKKYNCGESVSDFTAEALCEKIKQIDSEYAAYSDGAVKLYESVDITKIVEEKILS